MPPPQLDHIILLLPHADLLSPPPWLNDNFTLTATTIHPDDTATRLIAFEDGTYLELLAFTCDPPPASHIWASRSPGFLGFALTAATAAPVAAAVRSGIQYTAGAALSTPGGRTDLPFWCARADISAAPTAHASGVRGIAQFTVLVPAREVDTYVDLYARLMETRAVRMFGTARLPLATPVDVAGVVRPWVFVEAPTLDVESARLSQRGAGVVEVALRLGVEGDVGLGRASIDEMGVWIHFLR